ncbi:MAG: aminoacyl-histidine dipeptidase, partial [Lachnospiraceae bacterium]|nr:aminoacyl-histidine dipeptidase [Lachnospiraceae bacterium]
RSSKEDQKMWFANLSLSLTEKYGGQCVIGRMYPAWEYKRESELRPCFDAVHKEFYGTCANFASIHAGLECGIFYEKKPELDMISIGPDMRDIHTPNESLNVESAIRFYKFIEKLVERIALEK